MSITDELREAINELRVECEEKEGCGVLWYPEPTRDRFSEIADRIDQEHEAEVFDLLREHDEWVHDRDANYIQLPKDADGETIHLGDVMDNMHKDGFRAKRVTGICYHEGGQTAIEVDEDRLRWHNAYKLHHDQPDSWESVISEFAERVLRSGHQWGLDAPAATAEFVERCKRLAGEDA